ncbi:MAG: hypothetical protein MZV65_21465 [Chromatiales bacterium]|nr:hypothetical protein [Chromatiales bacterium]
MALALYHGEALAALTDFGGGHPFGTDRLDAFWRECVARGLDRRATIRAPVMAHDEDILRFHTAEYLERVKHQSQTGVGFLDCGDTPAYRGVYEAAATVVGTTLDAVAHSVSGEIPARVRADRRACITRAATGAAGVLRVQRPRRA